MTEQFPTPLGEPLRDSSIPPSAADGADPAIPFDPVPVRPRRDGWTAERQRRFILVLSETGCVSQAAAAVGLTPRSAFRLAARPDARAFARAWDRAMEIASRRLHALAHEYVVHGLPETLWKDGACVGERRRPSERLLIYLLTHMDAYRFGKLAYAPGDIRDPREIWTRTLPELLDTLEDVPPEVCEADPVRPEDLDEIGHDPRS